MESDTAKRDRDLDDIIIVDGFKFYWKTGNIIDYVEADTDIIIPSEIVDVSVVAIGQYAFEEKQLTSVVISDSVRIIGKMHLVEIICKVSRLATMSLKSDPVLLLTIRSRASLFRTA